ncbi:DNA recombination protein RmuC [Roseomonas sp. M0104]|uniref:DNA recombination protein RmuC homolog n=1 Tax=Teichococcus coralli TaxID=2545983 RepID=A0A845BEY3_9PROT|nr:DNA recombination protein RmuC [Pseudoroseomonas coralli]MXP64676.1 DNA recombination protein RmuC [Pseudoroseomonas coralli]
MSDWILPLACVAVLITLGLLALALRRRPAGDGGATMEGFALLAGKLEALAGTQERLAGMTADRLAQQDRLLAERLAATTEALNRGILAQNQRLDTALATQNERLARSLADSAQRTQETAGQIQERLAVIDAARQNMEALGSQVSTLAGILGNKQSRGAFGEMQLRQLIEDRLPPDGFAWQHTLSTGVRCDCLIRLPYPPGPVVVDSKFPLEAWQALRDAEDAPARTVAARQFSADMRRHVDDIARKYLIPGETAEGAILFVPSEAVFAELHTGFAAVVDEAQRRRVYVASPTTLWAMLSAMRALMQDIRMRAQAGRIQEEVGKLMGDIGRLNDRVGKLKGHFAQAQDDIRQIDISTDKILRVGARIEAVEVEEEPAALPAAEGTAQAPVLWPAGGGPGDPPGGP